jgi:plasmid stabilization system protein ParE
VIYAYGLHPVTQQEYLESVDWYSDRSIGATQKFILAMEKAIESICTNPKMFKSSYRHIVNTHYANFLLLLSILLMNFDQSIVIVAIYHQKEFLTINIVNVCFLTIHI